MKTALLLIAHGSRLPQANDDLQWLAAQLRSRAEFHCVQACYLEMAEPTIAAGAQLCIDQGADCLIMLPYFLSAGIHVMDDLTRFRTELAEQYAKVEFHLAEPLGRHPLLVDVVTSRIQTALTQKGIANTSSASRI